MLGWVVWASKAFLYGLGIVVLETLYACTNFVAETLMCFRCYKAAWAVVGTMFKVHRFVIWLFALDEL